MKISYYAKTDTGIVRKENQDAYGVNQDKNLFIVCDGMGGGAAGDFASKCAVDVMLKSFDNLGWDQIREIVGVPYDAELMRPVASLMLANRMLHNLTIKYPKLMGMGTTGVVTKFEPETNLLHIYHVGDSRVYRVRGGVIELLTKDHSKVNELVDEGKMREEEIKTAELQSMITRALGTGTTVKVDYKAVPVRAGDHYIMCSDGLNGEIEDFVIKGIVDIHKGNLAAVANELIIAANNSGGRDNTTVIALKIDEDGRNSSTPALYANTVLTLGDETHAQGAAEDKILAKFNRFFDFSVPRSAKENDVFANPVVIAVLTVAVVIGAIFAFSHFFNKKSKDFSELTGNVSGISLEIRTPIAERTAQIFAATDKISRLELLKETVIKKDEYTEPLANVQVLIEEKDGNNKFVGVSSSTPLEIKLPRGEYTMYLTYPRYKILNDNYYLADSVKLTLELSGTLGQKTVIMLPEKMGE